MWIVIKFDKKKFFSMQNDLKDKIGESVIFYTPKIKLQYVKKNKIFNKVKFILNDYMFCYHKNFEDKNFLEILKYTKGVKYLIPNYKETQKEIYNFITKCKSTEDKNGYINTGRTQFGGYPCVGLETHFWRDARELFSCSVVQSS